MAYTFEQLYARVLEQDIDTITSNNFNVQVGNDINTLSVDIFKGCGVYALPLNAEKIITTDS